MARPMKQGLDYFPLDVDFFEDEKILPISANKNAKGEAILIRLLCAIYRNGYFIQWSDGLKFKIANQTKVSGNLVSDVVTELVKYHFFDEALYKKHRILTSKGIQQRWSEATKRRVKIQNLDYWLLEENESESELMNTETEFMYTETPLNQTESTQKKGKEKKVKNNSNYSPSISPPEGGVVFNEVIDFYNSTCKNLPSVRVLTDQRKEGISARLKEYGIDTVKQMILIASESDFLNGGGEKGWVAKFDWLFKSDNFVKVLEGNYKTVRNGTKQNKRNDPCHKGKENLLRRIQEAGQKG